MLNPLPLPVLSIFEEHEYTFNTGILNPRHCILSNAIDLDYGLSTTVKARSQEEAAWKFIQLLTPSLVKVIEKDMIKKGDPVPGL